ncbi:hypothetical protein N7490_007382 [Penicillium lividum]|nr:hypothetical protein N7490_007382 [Penicillium lividum]
MTSAAGYFRHQDYTVAWICALPLEMAAAAAMLDERHHDLPARPRDDNTYILGRIGGHNVAIACLPLGVYGTTSATTVASHMQSTFKSIRFCLMVGIGGGAPSKKADIRLGDVVVSKPTRDFGGVIQYDYGKTVTGGRFERTGILNKPPTVLLTAISRLQTEYASKPSRIPALLSEAVGRNSRMREKFTYRGEDQDLLFDSEYDHPDPDPESTCNDCDTRRLIRRPARASHDPVIHYGLIASGNQVIKHGRTRDNLTRDLGILCFEMEAAGLMDNFPCLVIRGICDYSDSHKNKQWQDYAAATAAAYGKELLSLVHASHAADTLPLGSITDMSYYREQPLPEVKFSSREIALNDGQELERLLKRISSYDHERIHQRLSRKRLAKTTHWFRDHPDFQAWFTKKEVSIGSGKTMIATAIIDAAKYDLGSPTVFFYCENDHYATLDASSILSSFIKQLCAFLPRPCPRDVAIEIRKYFGPKRAKPDLEDLKDIFTLLFPYVSDTIYVVDGVDALDRKQAKFLLTLFRSLFFESPQQGSRILLLSRDQVPGYINIDTFIPGINRISTSGNVMQDIKTYIESSITDKIMCRKITDDPLLTEEIPRRLLEESSEMFLWVFLQLEILWDTCHTDAEIRSALAALPKGLEAIYGRCIERIDHKDSRVLKILKWVSFANTPLHIEELREAIAFDIEDIAWNAEKIPGKEFVIGCCANLVVMDSTDNRVRFAHSSSRNQTVSASVPFHRIRTSSTPDRKQYKFLDYAVANWALQTKQIPRTSVIWEKFEQLAMSSNETWNFHPWVPGGRSASSHLHSLLGWAVTEQHEPLLSIAQAVGPDLQRVCNLPLVGESLPALHVAAKLGNKAIIEILLDFCNVNTPDLEQYTALHHAASVGHIEICQVLLSAKKVEVNARSKFQFTPLLLAASCGHEKVVSLLIEKQADIEAKDTYPKLTPLTKAAQNGHEAVVKVLLEKGADLEAKDETGQTPLSWAIENGHEVVVKVLLEKGADLEAEDKEGRTPLLWAAENRHEVVVKVLLEKGADLEAEDKEGRTPLSWAAGNGHEAVVKLLLEKGVDLEAEDRFIGRTSLLWAAGNGHEAVVKLLLEKGVDLEAKDRFPGRTSLSWAVGNGHEAVVKLLLEKGADLEAEDKEGRAPLSWAAGNGHEAVVKFLLKKGVDLEAKDKTGQTPLLWAAESGHGAVVKLLLEKGVDLEAKDRILGQTPLLCAAENGHEAVVKLLLEKGVDLKAKDRFGQTPLSWATENGHEAVVKLLLEKGVDLEAKDRFDRTPLLCATENGNQAVVKVLAREARHRS